MSEKTSMGLVAKRKTNSEYSELLEKLHDIPTLPIVAMKVNELINDPNSSSADIADVLKKDQVLTAKVLRLVNSSYYAIPGGVADVQRALAFLGFNTARPARAESFGVLAVFGHQPRTRISRCSSSGNTRLAPASAARCSAKRLKIAKPEEAFTCGLAP